ncbi:hypothetical protein [Ruegeria sp.]|uniref:hypothetical protein n=1 Tax=Ruegeria sp. TaxID=1879320 RepID=UPI003B5BA77C
MTADFGFFFVILTTLYLFSPGPLSPRCEYDPGGRHLSTQIATGVTLEVMK